MFEASGLKWRGPSLIEKEERKESRSSRRATRGFSFSLPSLTDSASAPGMTTADLLRVTARWRCTTQRRRQRRSSLPASLSLSQ